MLLAQPIYEPALFDPTAWLQLLGVALAWAVAASGVAGLCLLTASALGVARSGSPRGRAAGQRRPRRSP